ncbi:hypothetical protein [Bacillus sp. FJAT-52991]|uniref:Uncharacterized protein n=1 Tax=Bacillus kandeliae TaxID=3129297 RepID=A0ABZ2NB87_9BACI
MENNNNIREAWCSLEKHFGPSYYGQDAKLKHYAQIYANEVLEANDQERIKYIGKKHLGKVANKELNGKQFDNFLSNVIKYERRNF